jgi:hypothetical protein
MQKRFGGTWMISSACIDLAIEGGIEVTVLTRGLRIGTVPTGVRTVDADINDPSAVVGPYLPGADRPC